VTPRFYDSGQPVLLVTADGTNARSKGLLDYSRQFDQWKAQGAKAGAAGWLWNAWRKGGRGAPVRLNQFPHDEQWCGAFVRSHSTPHDIAYVGCMVDAHSDDGLGSVPLQPQRGSPTMEAHREAIRLELRAWRDAGVHALCFDWLSLDGRMDQSRMNAYSVDFLRSKGMDVLPVSKSMNRRDAYPFIRDCCENHRVMLYTEPADGKPERQLATTDKWRHDAVIAESVMRRGDVLWIDESDTTDMIEMAVSNEITMAINGNHLNDALAEIIATIAE